MTRPLKISLAVALVALTFGTTAIGTAGSAQAWHHHHHGYGGAIAGGVAAGLLLGGIAAASAANTYEVRRECYDRDRYDRYGNYIRTVRVCRDVAY